MSVREIKLGKHQGLRVQRNVNGRPVVKDWSYRIPVRRGGATAWRDATEEERLKMREAAERYDEKLQQSQKKSKISRVYDPFKATARNNTGIRGMNFRQRIERGVERPALFITVNDAKGVMFNRYHLVETHGWPAAWAQAVNQIADIKGLAPAVRQRMIAACPDWDEFNNRIKSKESRSEPAKRKRVAPASTSRPR